MIYGNLAGSDLVDKTLKSRYKKKGNAKWKVLPTIKLSQVHIVDLVISVSVVQYNLFPQKPLFFAELVGQ